MTEVSASALTERRSLTSCKGKVERKDFHRYSSNGNTFVVTEKLEVFPTGQCGIAALCHQYDVDGCIIVLPSAECDCQMVYFNGDGSRAPMCGNGLLCCAHFVHTFLSPGKQSLTISTDRGKRRAFVNGEQVEVEMGSIGPPYIRTISLQHQKFTVSFVNTGVPHAVLMVQDINRVAVDRVGKLIRYHEAFQPSGTNVTFTEMQKRPGIDLAFRTYERGVEKETESCGTGAIAAAVICWDLFPQKNCLQLRCRSKATLRVRREFAKDTFWYFLQGNVSILG